VWLGGDSQRVADNRLNRTALHCVSIEAATTTPMPMPTTCSGEQPNMLNVHNTCLLCTVLSSPPHHPLSPLSSLVKLSLCQATCFWHDKVFNKLPEACALSAVKEAKSMWYVNMFVCVCVVQWDRVW